MSALDPFTAYADEPHIENGVHHPYTAFNQGWDARKMGAARNLNPYVPQTREHDWWRMGRQARGGA